jgi:hypothetical protein
VLEFVPAEHGKAVAEDQTDGLLWDVAGCAQVGRGKAQCLKPVPFALDKVRWFAWAHFYRDTAIAGAHTAERTSTQSQAQ